MVKSEPPVVVFAIDNDGKVYVQSWFAGNFTLTTYIPSDILFAREIEEVSLAEVQVQCALGLLTFTPHKDVGNDLPENTKFYLLPNK